MRQTVELRITFLLPSSLVWYVDVKVEAVLALLVQPDLGVAEEVKPAPGHGQQGLLGCGSNQNCHNNHSSSFP